MVEDAWEEGPPEPRQRKAWVINNGHLLVETLSLMPSSKGVAELYESDLKAFQRSYKTDFGEFMLDRQLQTACVYLRTVFQRSPQAFGLGSGSAYQWQTRLARLPPRELQGLPATLQSTWNEIVHASSAVRLAAITGYGLTKATWRLADGFGALQTLFHRGPIYGEGFIGASFYTKAPDRVLHSPGKRVIYSTEGCHRMRHRLIPKPFIIAGFAAPPSRPTVFIMWHNSGVPGQGTQHLVALDYEREFLPFIVDFNWSARIGDDGIVRADHRDDAEGYFLTAQRRR